MFYWLLRQPVFFAVKYRSIDILGEKEYNYIYNEGTLIEAIPYSVELNGEIVVGKTKAEMRKAIKEVYKDMPQLLKEALELFEKNWKK